MVLILRCILLTILLACQALGAEPVEVAVSLPDSGDEAAYGRPVIDGIRLAIDEANAHGGRPVALKFYDDKGDDETAKQVARQIVASRAVLMLGPAFSKNSVAAGPIYAAGNVASLAATCTADSITQNATTFRIMFKNSDQGTILAYYLSRVLGKRRAAVVVSDDDYGRTLREAFERVATEMGIAAQYLPFRTPDESQQIVNHIIADATKPAVVFLTYDADAARMLVPLRRGGVTGPFLGGDALGDEFFSQRMANEPEEQHQPGYFSEGVFGITPTILDSANAEILAFAERFRARYGHDPAWSAAVGYDTARLAVDAIQAGNTDRAAILNYLKTLNGPGKARPGLLGLLWFDAERGRPQAVRIGVFHQGQIESAPLQIVPVLSPDHLELQSGEVFPIGQDRYARLQRVVYTGMFVNDIDHIDLSNSSFNADFYIWLRYATNAGPNASDPSDIIFPNLVNGSFDREHPAERRDMPDDTVYRLWRVRGVFRNNFDLHRFPFDQQTLTLSLFNAHADQDRIVYVLDRRAVSAERQDLTHRTNTSFGAWAESGVRQKAPIATEASFRSLTQWRPLGVSERRENLVTNSALGDPTRVGADSVREFSGFQMSVDVQRRAVSTLAKTLLPLMLMTLIMFSSLYFPESLVNQKITVAVTGALSGAVLLTAINSQLGGIGYTVAVEYAFYVFFALSTLCIISVVAAERLRAANQVVIAARVEAWARIVFLVAMAVTIVGAIVMGT